MFTFAATAEVVALLGAVSVFVNADESTFNVTGDLVDAGFRATRRAGLRPVGVIPVDPFGQPAPYDEIGVVAGDNHAFVIADAAQSFGATANSRQVGMLARVSATSFFPAKPLGCYGDGGAVFRTTTNSPTRPHRS
jgi:dTDP-4-amino-4,6-dideoxygalactose transaminase